MPEATGQVIERPTGEAALLWQLYANALDKIEQLKRERRKYRKVAQHREKAP